MLKSLLSQSAQLRVTSLANAAFGNRADDAFGRLEPTRADLAIIALLLVCNVAILIVDIVTPLGYVVGATHTLIVIGAGQRFNQRVVLLFTAVGSIAIILGWLLSPPMPGQDNFLVAGNRSLSLVILWAIGLTVARRLKAEVEAKATERRTADLLHALPAAVYSTDKYGRLDFYNEAAAALWGVKPTLGESRFCGSWRLFWPDGAPMAHDECPMAIAIKEKRSIAGARAVAEKPDGTRIPFMAYPSPLLNANGEIIGAVNTMIDMTDRDQAEKRYEIVVNELNHRVKNILSIVNAIIRQTLPADALDKEVSEALEGRLKALSSAYQMLTRDNWRQVSLKELLEDAVRLCADGTARVAFLGEGDVMLDQKQAVTLAMAVHELCTNAIKYGALSNKTGVVSIDWKIVGDRRRSLHIHWRERGGPTVRAPERRGFGTTMIEKALAHEFGGEVKLEYKPEGLTCAIIAPLGESKIERGYDVAAE